MDEKIPYIAFEAEMARHERTIRRLLVMLILAVLLHGNARITNVRWWIW